MADTGSSRRIWFERRFELGLSPGALPDLVERLRGTPLRLEERTSGMSSATLTERVGDGWSIQEQAGHLADLERLWLGRLDDLAARAPSLRPADLQNRATWEADHNSRRIDDVLREFRDLRTRFVRRIGALTGEDLEVTAAHPRLGQPMSAVDLCFFVAEHDDHHLAAITELRRAHGAG